jgi:UDP-N-acetylmuramoyl-tripeptide--D-alanyl-D-alanine ligase
MKPKRLEILEKVLRWMAVAVLKKHKPVIVGITGSVGKSSAKEAIALVLASKFSVRKNEENYNNEIGIPLTVIGARSGKRSALGWLLVAWRWIETLFFTRRYPEILVLEIGIDRPGDMDYMLDFLPVRVGVFTNVSGSHLEFFGKVERIAKEKGRLIRQLPRGGTAVLCADNELVMGFAERTRANVLTYGLQNGRAAVRAECLDLAPDRGCEGGCVFKLGYEGTFLPVRLPHVVAEHHVPSVLAAAAVGLAFRMNLVEIAAAAEGFRPLPGRMRTAEGLRDSLLIDDTYNASPASLEAALKTLGSFSGRRRIAALGDMLELGADEERSHRAVALWLKECGVDVAYLVGRRMLLAYEALEGEGVERHWFEDPVSAAAAVRASLREGDVVLAKGSQGMRMELVSEAVLARPEEASETLCRQSDDWKRKSFVSPS